MTSASVHTGGRSNHIPTSQAYDEDVAYYEQRPNVNQFYSDVPASSSGRLAPQHDQRQYYSSSHSPQSQQVTSQDEYVLPYHTRSADSYDGPAPLPPPRTSSQQHQSSHSSSGRASSRQPQQNTNTYGRTSPREKSDPPNAAAAAARSRRKNPSSPEAPQRSTSARDQPQQSQPQQVPAPLVREYSEVINRVVVSDPRVDEDRLQERVAEAQPHATDAELDLTGDLPPPTEDIPGPARRQDYSKSASRRKDVQFGDYVLGQTLGEGEFGKVKLGWKKDGSSQCPESSCRLPKIYREISILRDLAHPNIVRLHEMVETERHIGIILEYASGGELFDYILNHRYLKDPAARRLFAQLVSGVGYLHKKGIVHRDLKLENLLLDQNRNIIITDFGFANTFDPIDVLGDEIEYNLTNKDYVRKLKLDNLDARGLRRGDLMQTSCGSPCYAAPELVVSDSLYTGRKVDVWSCGVILYAMLAGYLPFDDDPANPEGDNINLLYKYITTTPLTFPEYVSPHARDLLRRILVPDPRKRADLFEVARHSWLTEYVAPQSHTNRGHDVAPVTAAEYARSRGDEKRTVHQQATTSKPLPQDPPRPPVNDKMGPPTRPGREVPRSVSDSTGAFATQSQYATRPSTQGSIASQGQTRSDLRLPSRGSYGQPVAPTVATTNVQGRVSQPAKAPRGYNIGGPVSSPGPNQPYGQPANTDTMPAPVTQPKQQHHRRSSTLSGLGERLFGRSNSVRKKEDEKPKREKRYPPTSMKPMTTDGNGDYQHRSFSFGLGKKKSTDLESQVEKPQGRRFSLLPASMSFGRLMSGKEQPEPQTQPQQMQEFATTAKLRRSARSARYNYSRPQQTQHQYSRPQQPSGQYSSPMSSPPQQQSDPYDVYGGTGVYNAQPQHQSQQPQGRTQHVRGASQPMAGYGSHQQQYAGTPPANNSRTSMQQPRQQRGVLVKPNRKFTDAYDNDSNHQHGGSSGAVRKVQDFFRRRSRAPRPDGGDYR
ncbi:Fatty acyl-CoA synthetase and RNA processing-associated kinase 1 [Cyphellophora attinorum]|uniref:Fatty acyl-CoA synthetase and RNA processing-associated kinase 1 n=1 Tax=Cyphellophora attinorum TaxID=1664694 RepID=A0A0N1H6R7_9EURO|nr:Fatty acyl-CoA synthetase and RNA processing-associated kinase 1 [Phialophora attinorum]KPI37117.1 Fatty acyl-CoA synthetase and RNA processing-associated kinase 1 [Phialophora attinorum]